MTSISSVSGNSNAWATQRTNMQTRMFTRVDTDSSGGVNASELQTMLEDVSKHTGVSFGKTAQELLTAMDSNGDGSLGSEELAQGMQSVMPHPPSTMQFAQNRGGDGDSEDLFTRIDTDGDGNVSKTEMSDFATTMGKNASTNAEDKFSQLDTNGDDSLSQSEFAAGRPHSTHGGAGMQGASGPRGVGPMGPPPGGTEETQSSASSSSTTYDPLDTNQDGAVSEMERLAGALKDLAQTATDQSTSSADESQALIAKLAQKLYDQISTHWLSDKGEGSLRASA